MGVPVITADTRFARAARLSRPNTAAPVLLLSEIDGGAIGESS